MLNNREFNLLKYRIKSWYDNIIGEDDSEIGMGGLVPPSSDGGNALHAAVPPKAFPPFFNSGFGIYIFL